MNEPSGFIKLVKKLIFEKQLKLGDILGLNKNKIIHYPFSEKGWQDIRKSFASDPEKDSQLLRYYEPHWVIGDNIWESILNVAEAVNKRISYENDKENWGRAEYWATPYEVHMKRYDDCDGYAVLLCHVLRLLGLTEEEVFVRVGRVQHYDGTLGERHANVIVLDWDTLCFYPLEGSWYRTWTLKEFKERKYAFNFHPRYYNTEWITNDKKSFANTRWFKWVR